MNKQTNDKSENKKNATLSDSPALAFDRDKNEIYRPQDESIVPMEHTPGGGHLPDEDPI